MAGHLISLVPRFRARGARAFALCLLTLLGSFGLGDAARVFADDGADAKDAPDRVAFFDNLAVARELARETGRPLLVVVHVALAPQDQKWPHAFSLWTSVYADPEVVAASRACVCVLHRRVAAPGPTGRTRDKRPTVDANPLGPTHLLLDSTGRHVLGRLEGWDADPGAASAAKLRAFLKRAVARAAPAPASAPVLDVARVAALTALAEAQAPEAQAPSLPLEAPGFRVRLEWPLPVPARASAEGKAPEALDAEVTLYWNGEGPVAIGPVQIPTGTEVSVPLDVRFAEHPELAARVKKGEHRIDIYIEPAEGSFPFSRGPMHVGSVVLNFGEDGGGGGGGADKPEEQPDPSEQTAPPAGSDEPQDGEAQDPPPEIPENPQVVEPFLREGDTVEKEDAIVAVEDPDAGVKPPPDAPIDPRLRTFEKVLEEAVGWERIPVSERAFLKRYFDALRRAAERQRTEGSRQPPAGGGG